MLRTYDVDVRITDANTGEFVENSNHTVEIEVPEGADDVTELIMDEIREILNEENEGDEDWENGAFNWSIDYTEK
jgi:hypothetical protein